MLPPEAQEDSPPPRRTYTPVEAEADLATYRSLKRSTSVGTLLVVVLVALPLDFWNAAFALALVVGGVCGLANALLVMYGNERLAQSRHVAIFVLSSLLRIGLFGIVPVVLALKVGSVWTLAVYFAGFFIPLALYAAMLKRRIR